MAVTILLCADWLTVNQKKLFEQCASQSKLPSPTFFIPSSWKPNLLLWFTFQVSKWIFIYSTCDSDIVEAKLKIWKKVTKVDHISSFQVNFYTFDLRLRYCRSQVKNIKKSHKSWKYHKSKKTTRFQKYHKRKKNWKQ